MVALIKKGGLRERANRSRKYQGSENTETRLVPNTYAGLNKPSQIAHSHNENEPLQPLKVAESHQTTTTTRKSEIMPLK